MPPKKQDAPKKKDQSKIIEDKTFGMKNKKGGKAQKTIAMMQAQSQAAGKNKEQLARDKQREQEKAAKEAELAHKKEIADLYTQTPQRVPFGVDPKSIVCQYHKAGYCEKGKKCKFSHDLEMGRKGEKKDLYQDDRSAKQQDTMDTWDQAKLAEVVLNKHGNLKTTTDIVCNFFVDAIQEGKYGWFWTCPNGENCKYKHALPPGFVLKQKGKKTEDENATQTITLEEFLETERHKLPANLTPVTPESFAIWKKTRVDKKVAEQDAIEKTKQATISAGKGSGMSGRDLFTYNPELYNNDSEDEGGDDWDLENFRRQTEAERDAAEQKRIEALGGSIGSMQIGTNGSADDSSLPNGHVNDGS